MKSEAHGLSAIPLVCPLDGLRLAQHAATLRCVNGHSFDIARQGYVNLLPVQYKASRDPGDSSAMVAARRRVLGQGLFTPLADAIGALLADAITSFPAQGRPLLVDAGCGEGFYTAHFADALSHGILGPARVLGVDISKSAIAAAAGRHRGHGWVVASNHRLPVASGQADIITCLFGFEAWPQWGRLQRAGQLLLVVDAGPDHLLELRRIIYPSVRVHDAPAHAAADECGYDLALTRRLRFEARAPDPQTIDDILCMTPHGHKIAPAGRAAASALTELELTLDAVMRLYRHR